ncbi:MAG TPA: hypothetical protein VN915_05110 [Elusimicrobiota bacterium]|nr:hypothetical protein [Elusimicrobiota bacterium]
MRSWPLLALVLATLCPLASAGPAAAGEAAAASAPGAPPPGMTPCEVVSDERVWKAAKIAFGIIVSIKKTDVEGALPGRFVPGTRTWALRRPEQAGHFLRVECGADKVSCASVRDLLERRLAESSLVQAVSREPEKMLFDPKTWALTAKGGAVLEDAKRCRPGLWTELAPTLTGSSRE